MQIDVVKQQAKILYDRVRARVHLERTNPYEAWLDSFIHPLRQGSPDGLRYLAMAKGKGAPRPYHYRWLLPKLMGTERATQLGGDDFQRWGKVIDISLVGMIPAMRWLTGRWSPGLFMFGLSGVWKLNRQLPVLTDAPAMLAAIVTAGAVKHRRWEVAIASSLVAGATKESAPVFAALYSSHPLPLIGLVAPLVRHLQPEGPDVVDDPNDFSHEVLVRPFASAWWVRRGKAEDWKLWLAPWGALVAGFRGDPRTLLTLAAAYGQCTRATDSARLYQWAWPVLAENTVDAFGPHWPVALAAHTFNPWKGDGG